MVIPVWGRTRALMFYLHSLAPRLLGFAVLGDFRLVGIWILLQGLGSFPFRRSTPMALRTSTSTRRRLRVGRATGYVGTPSGNAYAPAVDAGYTRNSLPRMTIAPSPP